MAGATTPRRIRGDAEQRRAAHMDIAGAPGESGLARPKPAGGSASSQPEEEAVMTEQSSFTPAADAAGALDLLLADETL